MKIALLHAAISAALLLAGQSTTQEKKHTVPTHSPATARHVTTRRSVTKPKTRVTTATRTKAKTTTLARAATATAKVSPAPPTGSAVSTLEAKSALEFHNARRAEAGVPALEWSPQLATIAQAWADHLAKDLQCKLQHTPNNPYGENIFGGRGRTYTAMDASQMWFAEKTKYAGSALTRDNYASAGHYTQMMWRATTQVGIGVGNCNGSQVIVAEYSPHGNVLGQKPY